MKISASDNRDVLRNAKPRFQNSFHSPDCKWIIIGKNAIGNRAPLQQKAHRFCAHLFAVDIHPGSGYHERLRIRHALALKRAPVSLKAADSGAVLAASDMCNRSASLLDQVLSRYLAGGLIVNSDKVGRQPGQLRSIRT